jgi:acyl-CoA synthetase (AMP-forming)/AMP-acid ligase II
VIGFARSCLSQRQAHSKTRRPWHFQWCRPQMRYFARAASRDPSKTAKLRPGPAVSCPELNTDWDLAFYTSGSTGRARPIGVSLRQVELTADWYAQIYGATEDTSLATCLPATYNFAFIAVFVLASRIRAKVAMLPWTPLAEALRFFSGWGKLILIANPVLVATLANAPDLPRGMFVDSGGAPLSVTALRLLRARGIDVHEGYGLTETCSLTHFDTEGDKNSIGTVGRAMPGVTTSIIEQDGKPLLQLRSPNIGIDLFGEPSGGPDALLTTDIARIDEDGRLTLLGRSDDVMVSGHWPKDTLNAVGHILGLRCALVRHPAEDEVLISLLEPVKVADAQALRLTTAEVLQVPMCRVTVKPRRGSLLHSAKIPRSICHA